MTKKRKYRELQDYLSERLKDPEVALAYLNEALMDEDQRVFLLALKDVIDAQDGDISALAEEAQLNRQNIYRILSSRGNPRWTSLTSLFNVLGFQVQLSPKR